MLRNLSPRRLSWNPVTTATPEQNVRPVVLIVWGTCAMVTVRTILNTVKIVTNSSSMIASNGIVPAGIKEIGYGLGLDLLASRLAQPSNSPDSSSRDGRMIVYPLSKGEEMAWRWLAWASVAVFSVVLVLLVVTACLKAFLNEQ